MSAETSVLNIKLPDRFIYEEIFPFHESQFIEFKESFNTQYYARKYKQTICAFLNTSGGHLIFGIRDTDRSIQGFKMSSKAIDNFLLFVDSLAHSIKYQPGPFTDSPTDFKRLFQTRVEQIAKGYYICIISCYPEPNRRYCLNDKSVYIRTNASTRQTKSLETFYNIQDIKIEVEKERIQNQEHIIKISNSLYDYYQEKNKKETFHISLSSVFSLCAGVIFFAFYLKSF